MCWNKIGDTDYSKATQPLNDNDKNIRYCLIAISNLTLPIFKPHIYQ